MSDDARKAKKLEYATQQVDVVNAEKAKKLESSNEQVDVVNAEKAKVLESSNEQVDVVNAEKAKKLESSNEQVDVVNAEKAKTLERATRQLDIIEQMITMLVTEIDFRDLKTSERLNLALKLMTQHARTLKLYDDISSGKGLSFDQQALAEILNPFLRNETSDQNFDDPSSFEGDGIREGA